MKNSVLAGFHAVGARLRTAPETISVVYADPSRRDKRMRDMREKLLAAGVQAVVVPRDRSAGMTPAAMKAAAGAAETVPVVTVTNLAASIVELRDAGVTVVGTAGEAVKSIYDFEQNRAFAWVLGAEGDGLRQLTRKRCDDLAAIPMTGAVESLNVSVAAGICLFESVRQRLAAK